jgi:hypothetical protein
VRENPESWRHFIEYVPDEELPDEFDTIAHVQRTLGALGVTGVDADVVERSMRSFHRLHSGGHGWIGNSDEEREEELRSGSWGVSEHHSCVGTPVQPRGGEEGKLEVVILL